MTEAETRIAAALHGSNWAPWALSWLAGDASARRYARLQGPGGATAILMDMGPGATPDDWQPFLRIGAHLLALGLTAPEPLLDRADSHGVIILTDLGPQTVAQHLVAHPLDETAIYHAAIELLAHLQAAPPPAGLPALNPTRAAGMLTPLFSNYAPATDARTAARITGALQEVLATYAPDARVLSLRDFHAENLIWRPDQHGHTRLGLLDFQDAVLAPPEYDLASLTRDARRDVDPELAVRLADAFARAAGRPVAGVLAAAAVLAVQRNLRILGIFARLVQEGKLRYRALLPRVWQHLQTDLDHPALASIAPLVRAAISAP